MTVGEKIYSLRKEKGMSQEEFAEAIGVSRQSVSKWEADSAVPDVNKILAISKLFGVSTDFLLKDDPADQAALPESESTPDEPQFTEDNEVVPYPQLAEEKDLNDTTPEKKPKKKKSLILIIIAIVLALGIVAAAIALPIYFKKTKTTLNEITEEKPPVKYTYVLVHGLGGWGEGAGINNVSPYWGADAGDISKHLEEKGETVVEPYVGPVSSNWDRVCELYAQLTGTRVDYGEAHSKEHNHSRYGRTYTTALVPNWGKQENGNLVKINLVGHSFGGATVRTLTSLLEYGSEAEKNATGKDTSPLFTGGKGSWVYSVTTLCAPHNGSSLTCVLDSVGTTLGFNNTTQMLATLCFATAGVSDPISGIYDFQLDQFGIGKITGSKAEIENAISTITKLGNDHAGYDLSPDGAAKINSYTKLVKGVYYFSYAYCTTTDGSILGGQTPIENTLPVLIPTAFAMGNYEGVTKDGIQIDKSWQPNDGLVSVVSAKHPSGDKFIEVTEGTEKYDKGVWNYMGVRTGDHGTVIGLNASTEETYKFYDDLTALIDSLT